MAKGDETTNMEDFKRIHSELYDLLRFTGLWPVHEPAIYGRLMAKRIVYLVIALLSLLMQYKSLLTVELNVDTLLTTLSFSGPMVLFVVRNVSFLLASKTISRLFVVLQNDYVKAKGTVEMDLFEEYLKKGRTLFTYYLRLVHFTAFTFSLALLLITVQPKHHVAYLRYFGFYFKEAGMATTVVYNISKIINDVADSNIPRPIDIGPAVKSHLNAIGIVQIIRQDLGLSYLLTILAAIVSFALNLCRVFLALAESKKFDEAVVPALVIVAHVILLFLGNYCGQIVANTSSEIFNAAYNTRWYNIPSYARDSIIIIMMRSHKEVVIELLSLYTAGYEGYSMIIRSSLSYFTVLYSIH
ncbi:uncharacterized protein LOC144471076 isoform X2 [Augochlora pura]